MAKYSSLLAALTLLTPFITQASDIFVTDLTVSKDKISLGKVKNITHRQGYDNQPMFSEDNDGLFYTAMFEQGDKQQTDTMYYSFNSGDTKNITNTPHYSEYSPTPIDNGKALSMIFVDETGSQKLWQTDVNSGKQTPINLSIEPVGYHAWGKDNDLLLFVLGEEMMLQYAKDAKQPKAKIITKNIGRSLRYNPTRDIFTFSKSSSPTDSKQVLHQFDAGSNKIKSLIPLPENSQYYTWLNANIVISAKGNQLMAWHYDSSKAYQKDDWQLLADLSSSCKTLISRLAVAKDQSKLAFVCEGM